MNREDLAKLYEKANGWSPAAFQITMDELERFAALVAASEREKHKASIEFLSRTVDIYKAEVDALHQEQRNDIAEAIRARGNT